MESKKIIINQNEIEIVNEIPDQDLLYLTDLIETGYTYYSHDECDNDKGLNILNVIGEGEFGIVFEHKNYAIKHIVEYSEDDISDLQRDKNDFVVSDARILRDLQSLPHIPKVICYCKQKNINNGESRRNNSRGLYRKNRG